jgi:uncharacterized protein YndB with AHSA1/START domain
MIADPAAFENLNVQRVIRAPRERVFRAWTNPDDILKWFGPGVTAVHEPVIYWVRRDLKM